MAARDTHFMQLALDLAGRAADAGDVPVGAVLVSRGVVVGWGYNRRRADADPLGHAELMALRMAARARGDWRLSRSTLYATLEPCAMCAGAIGQARVERVVFGCRDPKAGAVRSLHALLEDPRLPWRARVEEGVCAEACAALLRAFFVKLRGAHDGGDDRQGA